MNQPNPHLSDLLRKLSFTAHTLNDMLSLAHDAGHSTRELEHIIHLIERELQIIRTAMRRRAEAENSPSTPPMSSQTQSGLIIDTIRARRYTAPPPPLA